MQLAEPVDTHEAGNQIPQSNQFNQFSLSLSAPACRVAGGQQGAVQAFLWMLAGPAEISEEVREVIGAGPRTRVLVL